VRYSDAPPLCSTEKGYDQEKSEMQGHGETPFKTEWLIIVTYAGLKKPLGKGALNPRIIFQVLDCDDAAEDVSSEAQSLGAPRCGIHFSGMCHALRGSNNSLG
jgi:hypothetical protein